jgi:glucuronosyltransferase
MPKEKLNEILKAFKSLKEIILWKYEGDIPAELPENVIVRKWFPQNDVLANKAVVLFITNGALYGLILT